MYCVVAARRGASNSQSDSLVVSSRVEQTSKPICLEYRVVVECSPLTTRSYSPQNRLYRVSPYRILITSHDLSCQCSVDLLITLSSNHFTRGKLRGSVTLHLSGTVYMSTKFLELSIVGLNLKVCCLCRVINITSNIHRRVSYTSNSR